MASPSRSTPSLAIFPSEFASVVSSGIFFLIWFRKSIIDRLNSFFAGRNAWPMSCISAAFAFDSIISTASGVLASIRNSRSILPV